MSGAEHGFLQPNPALFDLENRKRKPGLAHELGAGAKCAKCGDACPGFQLHFWRKVCINCRCGKAEHNVVEESDPGFYFVGKIFDRPLRTIAEECTFIYADVVEEQVTGEQAKQEVVLDWVPPGISPSLASKYMKSVPVERLAIAGSEGATRRKKALEKQFPLHDVEPSECHDLSKVEINSMTSYIDNVKKNIAGQGIVYQVGYAQNPEQIYENLPPPLPSSSPPPLPSSSPPSSFPAPPPELLDSLSTQLQNTDLNQPHDLNQPYSNQSSDLNQPYSKQSNDPGSGTYHAKPYHVGAGLMKGPKPYGKGGLEPYGRVGSAGSSLTSSPSPPQGNSPTPEEGGLGLSRPSQYVQPSSQNSQLGPRTQPPSSQNNYPAGQNSLSGSQNKFSGMDNMYPGNKTNTNPHLGIKTNDNSYPGNKTNDNAYVGNKTNDGTYPGTKGNDGTYPGTKSNDNTYLGNKTDEHSYPGIKTNQTNNENQNQLLRDENGRPVNPLHRGDVDNDYANVTTNDKDKLHGDPKHQETPSSCTNEHPPGYMPAAKPAAVNPSGNLPGGHSSGNLPGSDSEVWDCSGCGQPMEPGEVAIFAERAGEDKCWHPSCFNCSRCGEMLEDLLYFFSNNELYCGRDFAEMMKIPRCSACDELIFAAEYTGAEDQHWHLKHFCCWICDRPLAGHKYIPVDGQPHCLMCWQATHGKVCSACNEYIGPEEQRVSLGENHWHTSPKCFRCGVCSVSLLGGKMSRRGGVLLCSSACAKKLPPSQSNAAPQTPPKAPPAAEAQRLPSNPHNYPQSAQLQNPTQNKNVGGSQSSLHSPTNSNISLNSQQISPNSQHISPNSQYVPMNSQHVSPHSQQVSPKSQISPNSQHISSNSRYVSPNSLQVSPNSKYVSAGSPHISPNSQKISPNYQQNSPKPPQYTGSQVMQAHEAPKNDYYKSKPYEGVPQHSQQQGLISQYGEDLSQQYGASPNPYGRTIHGGDVPQSGGDPKHSQQYGGDPKHSQQYGGDPKHSQQYGGDPKHSQQYGGDPKHSHQYGGDPKHSQIYGGDPTNSQIYGGDPKLSQIYGGDPKRSQQYKNAQLYRGDHSQPYEGDPRHSQPYGGDPRHSQPYDGDPRHSQPYEGDSHTYRGDPRNAQLYGGDPRNIESYGGDPRNSQAYTGSHVNSQSYTGPLEESSPRPPVHVRSGSHSTIV